MPKQKVKKTILKRFKITASGKVIRGHQSARHRHSHKSKRRLRHFAEPIQVTLKQARVIKSLIT